MERRICLGALFAWCLTCWAGGAMGATLNGRLTTSAYTWRAAEVHGEPSRHMRVYQSAIANIGRIGEKPLSFHTYARVSGDFLDEVSGRQKYRIYHAYLRWRSTGRTGVDLRAGRQRIYGGVGYGTIDGVRAQVSVRERVQLTGYAGVLVPLVPDDGIGTWDEGNLWGAQALYTDKETALGVSFAQRSRKPLAYLGPGRFSGLVLDNDSRQFQRLGFDLRRELGGQFEVAGRLDLDTEDWEVQDLEVMGHVQATPELRISGGFRHRRPTLYLNSILSVFEVSDNREIEGRAFYRVNSKVSLTFNAARVLYDDEDSWRIGIGAVVGNGYVGYSRRIGYAGENDAFTAAIRQPLTPRVTLKADGSVSGYRLYDGQPTRDRALAGSLGLTCRPKQAFSFDVEGQVLRNKFYARDFRLFFRGSVWFFKRSQ